MCCHACYTIKTIAKRAATHVRVQATQPRGLEVGND